MASPSHLSNSPWRRMAARPLPLAAVFLLVNLFLVHPAFLPTLSEINPWDEAAYIHSGRTLLAGQMPSYADNPLVDVFYALTYLPFQGSAFWMPLSAWLGRLVLFGLLWLSAYLVARRVADHTHPLVAMGVFLVTPLAVDMLRFPSDPLFAGLAGLSFWQLLGFQETRERRNLWWGSLFLGLAALARNDGLILFPIFLLLVLLLGPGGRPRWRALIPAVVPFGALVGGYVLLYGLVTGSFELGTLKRTYDNFEAGHQVIYGGSGQLDPVIEAKLEARRVFGTPQENHYSVFNALRRNPRVYVQRLTATLRSLPQTLLRAYGLRFAALLGLLALRGALELYRRRQYPLLVAFLAWPAHLVTGFVITLFRPGHLQFPFYLVFALAAVGLTALLANLNRPREFAFWVVALGGLVLYGLAANKLAVYYGAAVLLVALLAVRLGGLGSAPERRPLALLVLLGAGLVIHGNFPAPKIPALGQEAKAQAVVFMQAHLEPGSKVAAGSPGVVWAAGMTYAGLTSTDVPVDKSPPEFLDWMNRQGIRAIYADHTLYNTSPRIWALITDRLGQGVARVFSADQGDIQVLLLTGSNDQP